ncbi:hypothetical protein PFTANZ_04627 [Plasmodium falciparum Tanzania (2000708)]|uniref:Inner membrane complex suture component n=2 Tax=Plasmodium falciparum TaxID=5833 RepID=A0A024W185_PLAFA|nr:hypothetical protein PFTANZ_04627 [Plasmodium falciparum Tanzania (2000708)]ETW47448.1 hypothetical protein PFMALIP_04529 [Plasmodium falciparum MaliPS096_E11]
MANSIYDKSNNSKSPFSIIKSDDKKLSKDTTLITERSVNGITTENMQHVKEKPLNEVLYNVSYNDSCKYNFPNNNIAESFMDARDTNNYENIILKKGLSENQHLYSTPNNNNNNNNNINNMDNINNMNPHHNNNYFNVYTLDNKMFMKKSKSNMNDPNSNITYNMINNDGIWNMKEYPSNIENYDYVDIPNFPYQTNNQLYSANNIVPPLYGRNYKIQENGDSINGYNTNEYIKHGTHVGRIKPFNVLGACQLPSLCTPSYTTSNNNNNNNNNNNSNNNNNNILFGPFENKTLNMPYILNDQNKEYIYPYLNKGMNEITNDYNMMSTNKFISPNYEYLMTNPRSPYYMLNYINEKKLDIFKKITLSVGTSLDDMINIMIAMLETSYKSMQINRNKNKVNLYDLYPFYNPDQNYTRNERPTLKTGSAFLDKVNSTLDATLLEKHKNLPKVLGRILIPKTQKTGSIVMDGINKILDGLLDEPISYHQYDYFSDKFEEEGKIKGAI